MKTTCIVAALALVTAAAAAAGDSQPQTGDPAKAEKKVCRSETATGSRVRANRICMTQAEWDELAGRTRSGIDDLQRQGSVAVPSKGPFG